MNEEFRHALRVVAKAFPVGAAVPVPREILLDLLADPAPVTDLNVAQIAARLGRKPSTVRAMCERGDIARAYKMNRREWRAPLSAVVEYEEAQRSNVPRRVAAPPEQPARMDRWQDYIKKGD